MYETQITSFSLESLESSNSFVEPGDHLYNDCFFAHRDMSSSDQLGIFKYPCRFDAYIAILCIAGDAEVVLNLRRYLIKKNTIFFSKPNDIIQLEKWKDSEFYVIAFNDNFIRCVNIDYKMLLSAFLEMRKRPCIEITDEETNSLSETFHNLSEDLKLYMATRYSDEILMTYISLSAYKAFSIVGRHQEASVDNLDNLSHRNEDYLNKFMELLGKNFYKERNIGFYASQICVTPKYLTSLIKRVSGKSAGQWIDESIVLEAKHLLKYSNMTVQEIADYLNFPNQSFFAQYFRRQTGMTPSNYKKQP